MNQMRRMLLNGKVIGILTVFLILFMAAGHAEEEQTVYTWKSSRRDAEIDYILTDGQATIIEYIIYGYPDKVVIPDRLNKHPVIGIGDKAFIGNYSQMSSVTIPEGVTYIGSDAFRGCQMESITIPSSVESIGDGAFASCSLLTSVTIPEGVNCIGNDAFLDCIWLADVTIPASVIAMGGNPFGGCKKISTINVDPENPVYASIDGVLFDQREKVLVSYPSGSPNEFYAIPQGTLIIGEGAFTGMPWLELTQITIPDSVISTGRSPFRRCNKLSRIDVDEGNPVFVTIDGVLFDQRQKVLVSHPPGLSNETYTIPQDVKIIGEYAFWHCDKLTNVIMPDGITSIGDYAFAHCDGLTSVSIPASVTRIGDYAFTYCPNLILTVSTRYAIQFASEHGVRYTFPVEE